MVLNLEYSRVTYVTTNAKNSIKIPRLHLESYKRTFYFVVRINKQRAAIVSLSSSRGMACIYDARLHKFKPNIRVFCTMKLWTVYFGQRSLTHRRRQHTHPDISIGDWSVLGANDLFLNSYS